MAAAYGRFATSLNGRAASALADLRVEPALAFEAVAGDEPESVVRAQAIAQEPGEAVVELAGDDVAAAVEQRLGQRPRARADLEDKV